jgi:hypothetical protein
VEEVIQVAGAAVERTVEVGVWGFLLLFPLRLLPVSFQVKTLFFYKSEFRLSFCYKDFFFGGAGV